MVEPRIGVWFQGGLDVRETAELAARAEKAGAGSVWLAEGPVARDAFITLSAIAARTERVILGTGVVNPFTRHPAQLAASFASLDELSGGRVVCGVGIGARDYLIPLGADVARPLTAAREMLEVIRGLLAREKVTLGGGIFTLEDVRLGFRPLREIPLYLAATGPKMCALAGEKADGIYLMYGTESYVRTTLGNAQSGAVKSSREEALRVASPIPLGVDDGAGRMKVQLQICIGLMLTEPNGEAMLAANQIDPSHAQRIRDGLASGGIKGLAAAVDDEVLERLAIFGDRDHCIERLGDAVEWGISEPLLLLSGGDPSAVLEVLTVFEAEAA